MRARMFSFRRMFAVCLGRGMLLLLSLVIVLANYLAFFTPLAHAAWYNSGYLRKKAITIDHTKVGQVSFDAVSAVQHGSGTSIPAWSFTVGSQSNRLLIVGIAIATSGVTVASNGVTYNGTTLTKLDSQLYKSNTEDDEFWYMVNPPSGANNVAVTLTGGSGAYVAAAFSYYNVDQTTPFGTDTKNSGVGTTASTTLATSANQLVVDVFASDTVNGNFNPTAPQTSLYDYHATFPQGTASSVQSSGTSTTMNWTDSLSDNWADIVVPLNPAPLSNFPVLISRTDADLKSAANGGLVQNSNGYDIIFTDSTETTKLDHEIEKYVASTGEVEMWVRLPTLSATTDTVIYMYFDNSSISTSQENKTGVWDSNFEGVWHMEEASGTTLTDSTANGNTATKLSATSPNPASGEIDGAQSYNGTSDYVTANLNLSSTNVVTLSFWLNWTAFANDDKGAFEFTSNYNTVNTGFEVTPDDSGTGKFTSCSQDGGYTCDSVTRPSAGAWHYYTVIYDKSGGGTTTSVDGGAFTSGSGSGTHNFANSSLTFMANGGHTNWGKGSLDEVQLSTVARSAGWVATEYNNQSSPSTFYSVGAAQQNSGGAVSPMIEQQININDGGAFTTGGTANGVVYLDPSQYSGTVSYYFEVTALVTSGNGTATLKYDAGTGSTVSGGSTIQITGINNTGQYQRWRSTSFTPSGGNAYVSAVSGTGISIRNARIIIVQTDSTMLTNTQTSLDIGLGAFAPSGSSFTAPAKPKLWTWNGNQYDGTVTVYFEASFNNGSSGGTSNFALYSVGAGDSCGTQVSGSQVSATGTSDSRIRSSAITLTTGTSYIVCGDAPSSTAHLHTAQIIVQQNATGGLSKIEMQHIMVVTQNTATGSTYQVQHFDNHFDPANYAGGTFTYYYEANISLNTSGTTVSSQLYDDTAGAAISGSAVSLSSTTPDNVRSSDITSSMPSSADDLASETKDSGSATVTIEGSWLVIDVNSLQTPENLLPLLPLALFLPGIPEWILKRKKGRQLPVRR